MAVQLRLAGLPERAAVGARRLGARRVARLAGVARDPAAVMPHGEAGAPALLVARLSAGLVPRVSPACPGRRGTRGCLVESWRTRGSLGFPHDSTSPAPACVRWGGRKARLRPMPVPSWIPVRTHMKAARSEPAARRPSLLPGGQCSQAHSAEMETLKEAFDDQTRKLSTVASPFNLGFFHPHPASRRTRASLSSPLG